MGGHHYRDQVSGLTFQFCLAYPSGLIVEQFEECWRQLVVPSAQIAGQGDLAEDVGTGLPHPPHLVLAQDQKQGELQGGEREMETLASHHLPFTQ